VGLPSSARHKLDDSGADVRQRRSWRRSQLMTTTSNPFGGLVRAVDCRRSFWRICSRTLVDSWCSLNQSLLGQKFSGSDGRTLSWGDCPLLPASVNSGRFTSSVASLVSRLRYATLEMTLPQRDCLRLHWGHLLVRLSRSRHSEIDLLCQPLRSYGDGDPRVTDGLFCILAA